MRARGPQSQESAVLRGARSGSTLALGSIVVGGSIILAVLFAEQDKVVCKSEAVVGSLLPKRTCRTKAEWDQLTRDSRDLTNDIQTRRLTASPLNGG